MHKNRWDVGSVKVRSQMDRGASESKVSPVHGAKIRISQCHAALCAHRGTSVKFFTRAHPRAVLR
jgi:hypothetical protein